MKIRGVTWGGSKTGFADPALIIPIDAFVCKQTRFHDFVLICILFFRLLSRTIIYTFTSLDIYSITFQVVFLLSS